MAAIKRAPATWHSPKGYTPLAQISNNPQMIRMLSFQKLDTHLNDWRMERNLTDAPAQYLRFVEEVGEFLAAVRKDDPDSMIDEFGDVIVTIAILDQMRGEGESPFLIRLGEIGDRASITKLQFDDLISSLFNEVEPQNVTWPLAAITITEIGNRLKLDPLLSLNTAWEKIKDRKGKTIAGKGFVKFADIEK